MLTKVINYCNYSASPTKSVAISNLCSPAPYQVDPKFFNLRQSGIPAAHKFNVLIYLIRLDLVKDY